MQATTGYYGTLDDIFIEEMLPYMQDFDMYDEYGPFNEKEENYFKEIEDVLEPEEEEFSLDEDELLLRYTEEELKEMQAKLGYEGEEYTIGKIEPVKPRPDQDVRYEMPLANSQEVMIRAGKINVLALIDTGSMVNIMNDKVFYRIRHSYLTPYRSDPYLKDPEMPYLIRYNQVVKFKTLSTMDQTVEGIGMAMVKFYIGNLDFVDDFCIVRNVTSEVILGRDFMKHTGMVIDYQKSTITFSPYLQLYTVSTVVIPPQTEKVIKTHSNYYNGDLREAPLQIDGSSDDAGRLHCKTNEVNIRDGIADIKVFNETSNKILIPPDTDIARGRLRTMRENVLQKLAKALEYNRSDPIDEKEGVTHGSSDYWMAINQINLDESILNRKEREALFDIIFKQRGALSIHGQIGKVKNFYYNIKMKDERIFNKESYRMNSITKQIFQQKIAEFMKNGVAIRYMSEYSSPALLIKKPSSKGEKDPWKAKYRIVIDLREMNESAIHLQYSLPIIHELTTELDPTKNRYYTLIDVSDAFYQVQLHPDSYKYTTFKVPQLGSYCLTRLPQGYVGGPSIFQAVIENLFPDSIKEYLTYYIDDILIMTETAEKHLQIIQIVLYTLRQNGMKIKIEKCQICPEELDFLGVTLCKEGVKVKADKCEAIVNIKVPRTKKQVRSFLGAVGYYRRYIRNFAQIAKPLHRLTKDDISNQKVPWDEICQQSFDTLKQKLVESPILGHMDYSRQTILRTDSSGVGLGASLIQVDPEEGKEVVIAYFSRVLQPHEYNYDITTREALAVLSAIRHFATYLRFVEDFIIQTDHIDLKYIFKGQKRTKQESHRLIRWALYLSGFPSYIQFCSGTSPMIRMVDFLSRHNYEDLNEQIGEIARQIDVKDLARLEANCPDCGVDCYEKVSEDQKPLVPDTEQLKTIKIFPEPIGNIQPMDDPLVELPRIVETNPEGKSRIIEPENKLPKIQSYYIVKPTKSDTDSEIDNTLKLRLRKISQSMNDGYQETNKEAEDVTADVSSGHANEELQYDDESQETESEESDYSDDEEHINLIEDDQDRDDAMPVLPPTDEKYIPLSKLKEELDEYEIKMFSRDQLREMQRADPHSRDIIDYIEGDELPPEKRKAKRLIMMADHFFLDNVDNLLFHLDYPAGGLVKDYCIIQLYIPEELTNYVIQEMHAPMHLGKSGLIAQIRQRYWFPRMVSKIDKYIQNCNICQLEKHMRIPYRAPLKPRRMVTQPGEVWYLDHMGPIRYQRKDKLNSFQVTPWSNKEAISDLEVEEYKYVLIAVDSYSQYVELILCNGTTAVETADKIFKDVICRHSWPRALIHDQGTAFTNKLLEEFTRKLGIKNYQTAAMNPRSNGLAEARVKIVSVALAKLVNERKGNWYDYIPSVQFAMNCVPSKAHCISPFVLQHGRMPNDPLSLALIGEDNLLRTHVEYCSNLLFKVKMWRKVAQRCRRRYNKEMEKAFEKQIKLPTNIQIGELCYLHVPYLDTETKGIKRLNIPWRGPFAISDIKEGRLVKLIRTSDLMESDKWYPVHRLKITQYGLDPPILTPIKDFTVDYEYDENTPDITADNFNTQPWDDNTLNESDEEVQKELEKEKDENVIEKDKIDNDLTTDSTETPAREEPRVLKYKVKVPPRTRTTRQAVASNEPSERKVAKLLKYKELPDGTQKIQILCEGDSRGWELWVTVDQLEPITDNEELKQELKDEIENLKQTEMNKKRV